ncbi:MAG: L-threonylcarbamoyladenylate synthase [Bdellovibrionales bacterium]|nr:L-threonylcarbamoyladenylate synthase [Bdellovibrionales bacterium]
MKSAGTKSSSYKEPVTYDQALSLLKEGEVVALPTETVYGLAGRIDSQKTLEDIFHVKRRPFFDPLIVHCYDISQAKQYVEEIPFLAEKLWRKFSPGPLTLVLKKNSRVSPLITAHQDTVALRIPRHPLMRQILRDLEIPLAAPSANMFGHVSPTRANHVLTSFQGKVPVVDGGICEEGLESTIAQPLGKQLIILRKGSLSKEEIQNFLTAKNVSCTVSFKSNKFIPGGQKSHYAPSVPLYIVEYFSTGTTERVLKERFPDRSIKYLCLNSKPELAARSLYHDLRKLSRDKKTIICVQKTPEKKGGLWDAIWDRLEKASTEILSEIK